MFFSKLHQKLTNSQQFINWQKDNSEDYLSHFYCQLDNEFNQKDSWEIGYYDLKTDKITIFLVNEKITIKPEEDVFKKEGKVAKLDLNKVTVDFQTALDEAKKIKEEKHSAEIILNGFVILQNWKEKNIWNVSFATKSLKILNIKLDATSKELISDQLISFVDQQKGSAS